jgi:hypothetical protein
MWDAMQLGVDFIEPRSARKGAEMVGNEKGQLAPMYNENSGYFNSVSSLLKQGYLMEGIDWNTIGNQLDIDPSGHNRTTLSTQKDSYVFIDVFDGGKVREGFEDVANLFPEYNALKIEMSERGLKSLIDKIGLEESEDGSYSLVDDEAFMDIIREDFERRLIPDNAVEAVKGKSVNSTLLTFWKRHDKVCSVLEIHEPIAVYPT